MAISKKSLGKVLAISMASAMAMSSLSAALVSVSAVQNPALASNGVLELNNSVETDIVVNGNDYRDVEKAIQKALGADGDNHVDSIAGGTINLQDEIIDNILKTPGAIKFTDNSGLTAEPEDVKVKFDEVKFNVSGGGADYDSKTYMLTGANSKGSATLTMTVKAEVNLGADKKKTFTLKHTIDIDNHKAEDYDLKAYKSGTDTLLAKSDVNDLAAYGDTIDFKLIQYAENGGDFNAALNVVTGDVPESNDANLVYRSSLVQAVNTQIDTYVEDGTIDKTEAAAWKTKVAGMIPAADKDGFVDKTKAEVSGALSNLGTGEDTLTYTQKAPYGYAVTKKDLDTSVIKTAAVKYTKADAESDIKAAATAGTKELKNNVTVESGKSHWRSEGSDLLLIEEGTGTANLLLATLAQGGSNGTNDTLTYGDLLESVGVKYWTAGADANTDGTLVDTDNGGTKVTVYKLKAEDAITAVNKDKAVNYVAADASDWGTAADAALAALKTAVNTAKADDFVDAAGAVPAYIKAAAGTTSGAYNDTTILATEAGGSDNGGKNLVTDYLTIANCAKMGEDVPNKEADAVVITAIKNAYTTALTPGTGDAAGTEKVRFYAKSGDDLFKDETPAGNKTGEWAKGSSSNDKGVTINGGLPSVLTLKTDGSAGSATIKVSYVDKTGKKGDASIDVKVVKAVQFADRSIVEIEKSGSKTCVKGGAVAGSDNISGYEIRVKGGTVNVVDGSVGKIKGAASVIIDGGRAGVIDADGTKNASVSLTQDAVAGDILDASIVMVDGDSRAGTITDGEVILEEGTIAEINTNDVVTIKGGTVTGDVRSEKKITITSEETDDNDNPLDVVIGGNVIGSGDEAVIDIDNQSDNGEAYIRIGGYVLSRFVNTEDSDKKETVKIGSAETSGIIEIQGAVEGESVVLGGNGLLSLAGVRACSEVDHGDKDGEIVESNLKFSGFNSVISSISKFANVTVDDGTVTVDGAVNATTLTVNNDAQIVADEITVDEDIEESGSIVVPLGKLTVTGRVDGSPSLAFLGDINAGDLAFTGSRGLVDAFETGGITLRAERQSDGNYKYSIDKVELDGLTAVGKDVALGVGQTKTVSLVLDGTMPEGASIEWSVDDSDVATVTGNGMTATITGKEIDETTVTAKIVDANGRELGFNEANFEVNVLGVDTVDSIGGDIGPDDNQVDLDTKKKNMEAGQVYTFMVRGNNDVENISVTSGDTNVATVALANGTDSRGALYNITAVADGKTDITVTYQGKTSKIAVKVGGFQLDTSSKKMAPGQVYSVLAKNVPADQAGNVTLAYDNNIVDVVKVNDNYNGRGVLFNVTAKAIGETEVKVTHNGETETMAVNVVENTGRLTLDTASYTMPFGGSYTIGVKVEKNGRQLSGEEVRAMITSGELVVTDSRTGSIVTTEVQANGNVRVTGRQKEGTTYVQFIVMQNGQRVTHASVGVTVQNGATAGGSSVRSISQW